jgi:hypothetical protein
MLILRYVPNDPLTFIQCRSTFVTDIATNIPLDLQLTADVPDGLVVRPFFVTVGEITPLPAALPLFASGLGALGLLGWRRKRKNTAAIAA